MSVAGEALEPVAGRPTGPAGVRRAVTGRLMDLLDGLVHRHWALVLLSEHVDVHADLIAAEVSHRLADARDARLQAPRDG
jgi:hypothetical protein